MFHPNLDSIGLMAVVWAVVLWAFGRSLWKLLALLVQDPQFRRLLGVVLLLLASGAHIYHRLEGWSYLDAFYFTVITLTTVGYGDFSPQTALGKTFSMLYILLGLGVLGALIALIGEKSHEWTEALRVRRKR
ncbi:MAG: two pore domain potassium channel family protein [Caldilineaceae bacterium]|nr:two pore domain potassium channel family protein [Caldilineaceae bacterium]